MPFNPNKYGDEVQKVSKDTPLEEIIYLLKRDGGVFIKGLISKKMSTKPPKKRNLVSMQM